MNSTPRQAFSLIEAVVVVVVIAILAAVAIPRFATSTDRQRLSAAADRVVADLELARRRAYTASEPCTVRFDVDAEQYELVEMADQHDPDESYVVRLEDEPYLASILSVDFGGSSEVVFDLHGSPDTEGTIVISAGNRKSLIRLDRETGKATVEE